MEIIQNISIDTMDNHVYEKVYSKQYDTGRKVYFSVTKNGSPFNLENISASFQMKKSDGTVILKTCNIENNEFVIVELDRNITVLFGNRIPYQLQLLDISTKEIICTTTGYLNIEESVVKMDDIESSSDFTTFSDILIEISIKNDEAKYAAESAKASEEASLQSELNAKESENIATKKANEAFINKKEAEESANKAKLSELSTKESEENSKKSAESANESLLSSIAAANEAKDYSVKAKSLLCGGTGTRENEDVDNSRYYYQQIKDISNGLSGILKPMGTIDFSDLESAEKEPGYMYNIRDSFVTNNDFKEGSGYNYPPGTNIYYTSDGYWDCLAGTWGNIVELLSDTEPIQNIGEYWIQEY